MLKIGEFNQLQVIDSLPFGFYLDGGAQGDVLLSNREAPEGCEIGDTLTVFVCHDSDERLVASFEAPKALVGEIATMRAVKVLNGGTFVDWGNGKQLFVPRSKQALPMAQGLDYVVGVQIDRNGRLIGTSKIQSMLEETTDQLQPRQKVELLIVAKTDMGFKAAIDGKYLGLIFKDEVIFPLRPGQVHEGFVKRIREDGKIDLCFQFHDAKAKKDLTDDIMEDLLAHGGISTLTDKSPADEISQRFGVSKAAYKKAIGALYKERKILLTKDYIKLPE